MRKNWLRWTPGILLVVGLFVAGCTDQKEGDSTSRAPGEGVTQGPREQAPPMTPGQSGSPEEAKSPEPMQPDTGLEQKPEQKQKQTPMPERG
jgi:hypothetical protein